MSKPIIQHIWSGDQKDAETARRMAIAYMSWERERMGNADFRSKKFQPADGWRNALGIGDVAPLPFIHDMIESCLDCNDDDIIFITNADIGIYHGCSVEIADLCAKHGACYAYRWDFPSIEKPLTSKEEVASGKWYVGCDAFAFTKRWWMKNRHEYPDFVLGRECWDWILRALITETGGAELQKAIFHEKHDSFWKFGRAKQPGNVYNRSFARAWLNARKLPLREIANAPFKPVEWPPVKQVEQKAIHSGPEKMDVLIVLGQGSKWQNQEIKYCLRSIEKHAKNVGKVFVVGSNPGFLSDEVNMIELSDPPTNKEHRIAHAVSFAALKTRISEHFLWINDDTFFIEDVNILTYPYYNDGDLTSKWQRTKPNGYRVALNQTDAQLKARNLPNRNFEQHVPIIYSKTGIASLQKWVALSAKVPYGLTFRSIYCNVLGVKPGPQYKDIKIGSAQTAEELKAVISGRQIFSIGDGLGDDAKGLFEQLYPDKSKYER